MTLPLYVIVHTVHFEVSHDMAHQMYVKNIIINGPELVLYVTMRKNMGKIFFLIIGPKVSIVQWVFLSQKNDGATN